MVTLEWRLERSEGVTLVGLVVAAERPCRVRVENRLDGPVWPPRRHGQPAAGWTDGAFAGHVPADGRLTLGYATPAAPAEPPAAVVETEPADEGDADGAVTSDGPVPDVDSSPAGVVRALGDPVVPRDCVPVSDDDPASVERSQAGSTHRSRDADNERPSADSAPAAPSGDPGARGHGDAGNARDDGDREPTAHRLVVPGPVRRWFRDVADRVDAAEGRTDGEPDRGPVDSPLSAARAADRQALRRVRRRADELLARADRSGGADRNRPHGDADGEPTGPGADGGDIEGPVGDGAPDRPVGAGER